MRDGYVDADSSIAAAEFKKLKDDEYFGRYLPARAAHVRSLNNTAHVHAVQVSASHRVAAIGLRA